MRSRTRQRRPIRARRKRAFQPKFDRYNEPQWQEIWQGPLKRDPSKCMAKAKKVAEITHPEIFCLALQHFVDGVFPEPRTAKSGFTRRASFQTFVKALHSSHKAAPMQRIWYTNLGTSYRQFVAWLEEAAEYDSANDSIRFLNNRIPDFGINTYDGYLLTEFGK